jgi:hypothetical protein
LEAETNKYCPGGYETGAISNLITWVLNFFLSVVAVLHSRSKASQGTSSAFCSLKRLVMDSGVVSGFWFCIAEVGNSDRVPIFR